MWYCKSFTRHIMSMHSELVRRHM